MKAHFSSLVLISKAWSIPSFAPTKAISPDMTGLE
jgi:hypothetical protein